MTINTLCDIGNTVYLIIPPAKIILKELTIVEIHIRKDDIVYEAKYKNMNVFNYMLPSKELGDSWFLSKKEAERKLNKFVYNFITKKWELKPKENNNDY